MIEAVVVANDLLKKIKKPFQSNHKMNDSSGWNRLQIMKSNEGFSPNVFLSNFDDNNDVCLYVWMSVCESTWIS